MIGRGMYMTPKSHGVNDLIVGGAKSVPTVQSVDDETGSLIVSHRERVSDVIAPSDDKFHVQTYTVQAGLESTFPWLSQLAACYEEYEILQCVFEYRGHEIVGMQNTLDLQGQVIAATKYNVKSKSFQDRHEMQAYPHSAACSLNGTLQSGVEAHPGKIAAGDTHRYIRAGGLSSDQDATDFDHARFELALTNTPDDLFNKEVGQLFCYYTVKLTKPRLHGGRGKAISSYHQYATSNEETRPFGDVDTTGTDQPYVASKNTLGMSFTAAANDAKWTFPPNAAGKFRCFFLVKGTGLDSASTDFGAITFGGEVTGCDMYPNTNQSADGAIGVAHKLESYSAGQYGSVYIVDVVVRPQVGATSNSVQFANMAFNDTTGTDDAVFRSIAIIEEINDFDANTKLPEVKGLIDGKVRTTIFD